MSAKRWPQYLAATCICIGAMGTGTIIGWTGNISRDLEEGKLNNVKYDLKWVGSIMCLGALTVCIPIGFLANALGRKLTCLLTVIPFCIGWALILFGKDTWMMLVARFLLGMAGGSFCIVAPLYACEIAEVAIRGMLGTFLQLFITIGILYAYVFGKVTDVRFFCYLCAAVPIVFLVVFILQPETPVYLIKKGKKEKALSAYKWLRGKDYDPAEEIKTIETQIAKDEEVKGQFLVTLKTKQGKKSSLICFGLMFYQQLSGINAVMFFASSIFIDASSSIDPKICTIIIGVVQVIATLVASLFIDKVGRKILMMLSCGFMAFSTLLLSIYFFLKESGKDVSSIGILPLLSLIVFIIAFSIGAGPIPWMSSAELFPTAIVTLMSAYAGTFNWFLAFLVSFGYEPLKNAIGAGATFVIFAAISTSGVVFEWLVVPETKGKTSQEIQEELGK